MWTISHTQPTSATPERIWGVWSDVTRWPDWDDEIKDARCDGPLRDGAVIEMKPRGGPRVRAKVHDTTEPRGFSDTSSLPGARMTFIHVVRAVPGRTEVTHSVTITGPMTFLYARVLGRKVAAGLPGSMATLARIAERDEQ